MKLLFVCTGNTCRSPMAQALAEKYLSEKGFSASCDSAGVSAIPGQNMAQNAKTVLGDVYGISSFSHAATPLTRKMLEESDLVIAMTENHRFLIIQKFGFAHKVISLPEEVGDPFGGDLARYGSCAEKILKGIEKLTKDGVIHE